MAIHRLLLTVLCAVGAPGIPPQDAAAQRRVKEDDGWKRDPYTEGDAARMAKAGYTSFGPFPWGDDHDRAQIEHVLGGGVKLLWVETEHFKIGSSLPPYRIRRDKEEHGKLLAELKRLREKLPEVDPRTRELDRWLRLHLFAQRFEETYADFCKRLAVGAESFPRRAGELVGGRYMGEGPYLGQPAKFTVLLLETKVSAGHYVRTFLKIDHPGPLRHNSVATGSLLYVTAAELEEEARKNDTALHGEAVFNCVHSLVDGYRYYRYSLPHWFRQGLAHWYLRRVSPRYNLYREETQYDNRPEKLWDWAPRVHARAKFDHFPRAAELLQWRDEDEQKITDSMMVWSRMDYLMSLGDEGMRTYLHLMSEPFDRHQSPTRQQILDRQALALRQAWGLDAAAFDERWRAWVLATYPAK